MGSRYEKNSKSKMENKTYAKTAPHEYIVDEWNIELFKEICHLIDTEGYEEKFYDKPFKYYNIGEHAGLERMKI